MDRRIRWHYTTTILRLRIGARLKRYRNCKFHNFARTISRHADGISRYSVPPSAGPLLPLLQWLRRTAGRFARHVQIYTSPADQPLSIIERHSDTSPIYRYNGGWQPWFKKCSPSVSTKVCVELPTSAVNVALPASAIAPSAAASCCCAAGRAAVDRHTLRAHSNKPAARCCSRQMGETDGYDLMALYKSVYYYYYYCRTPYRSLRYLRRPCSACQQCR